MSDKTWTGTHTINCFCPGCNYSVSRTATSTVSQSDADNKAESAATSAFSGHNCPCGG